MNYHNEINSLPCQYDKQYFESLIECYIYLSGENYVKDKSAEIALQADAHIEELEADLKTTRATIRIMDQTKGYMQERIEELEEALQKANECLKEISIHGPAFPAKIATQGMAKIQEVFNK